MKKVTRFKCPVCGKITAGRLPVNQSRHRERGDGTFYFPRRHNGPDGEPCPGNIEEAIWVDLEEEDDPNDFIPHPPYL